MHDFKLVAGELAPPNIAVAGGAEETTPSQDAIREDLKARGIVLSEDTIIMPPAGLDWIVLDDSKDRTMGHDPFRAYNRTVGQFFNDTPVYWRGLVISRWQIIQYAAYHLGHIHTEKTKWSSSYPEIVQTLDQVQQLDFGLPRDVINYLLLGFARTLSNAASATTFIEAVEPRGS